MIVWRFLVWLVFDIRKGMSFGRKAAELCAFAFLATLHFIFN